MTYGGHGLDLELDFQLLQRCRATRIMRHAEPSRPTRSSCRSTVAISAVAITRSSCRATACAVPEARVARLSSRAESTVHVTPRSLSLAWRATHQPVTPCCREKQTLHTPTHRAPHTDHWSPNFTQHQMLHACFARPNCHQHQPCAFGRRRSRPVVGPCDQDRAAPVTRFRHHESRALPQGSSV